jgi:hypothetical protein
MMGGDDDPASRVVGQLGLVSERLEDIHRAVADAVATGSGARTAEGATAAALAPYLEGLNQALSALGHARSETPAKPLSPHQELLKRQAEIIDATLIPLLRSMAHQLKRAKLVKDPKLLGLMDQLEYLDTLSDLIDALKDLDTDVFRPPAPPRKRKKPPVQPKKRPGGAKS